VVRRPAADGHHRQGQDRHVLEQESRPDTSTTSASSSALCRGPDVTLLRVWIGEKVVFTGTVTDENDVVINQPTLFGGDDLGNGGVVGTMRFYDGAELQSVDAYLAPFQQQGGDSPAYRGTCHGVWKRGYVGNNTSIEPWKFELRRLPNSLGVGNPNAGADANPAEVLYEILTDDDWGLGFLPTDIDTSSFVNAGNTLSTEGNGWSYILDRTVEITDLIKEIMRQIDGVLYMDRSTGKWKIKLARADYTIGSVPQLTRANIIETKDFSRGAWQDTTNQVRVEFVDRAKEYAQTYAMTQDMANIRIQNANVSATNQYPGVKNRTLANSISWRDLRALSFPLAKVTIVVDRSQYAINPFDVIAWTDPDLGFNQLPMRVSKVDLGELAAGRISLSLVQDVFATFNPIFGAPIDSGWVPPSDNLVPIGATDRLIIEAPKAVVDRAGLQPGQHPRVWVGIRNQADGAVKYTINADLNFSGDVNIFSVAGTLLAQLDPLYQHTTLDIAASPDTINDFTSVVVPGPSNLDIGQNLTNLLYIGDSTSGEFISIQTATINGANIRLNTVTRGLLDSTPKVWPIGTRVWVMRGDVNSYKFTAGSSTIRPLTVSGTDTLTTGEQAGQVVNFVTRYNKPYPPHRLTINSSEFTTGTANLANATFTPDGEGLTFGYVRRDFRTGNEYDAAASEATLPADFPAANTTIYKVQVRNDPNGANTLIVDSAFNAGTASIQVDRALILRGTAGVVPSRLRVTILTRHTVGGVVFDGLTGLQHDFNTQDTQLATSFNMGSLAQNVSGAAYTAPTSGTYAFTLNQNILAGAEKVEANINGGAFTTIIAAGATTGNLLAVVAGDIIRVRHNKASTSNQTVLIVDAPASTSDAYAVLQV
jgi:hypothetical protein